MKWFNKIFDKFKNSTDIHDNDEWWQPLIKKDSTSSKNAFANIGIVYACVERRANAVSKLPLQVFEKTDNGRVRLNNQISYLLATRPNSFQTPIAFKKYIIVSQLLWGNAYIKMDFDSKGHIKELIPLNPEEVVIQKILNQDRYNYSYRNKSYIEDEIIHIPYISHDGKRGVSPLSAIRERLGIISSMDKFENNFYKKGTVNKGALKIPSFLEPEAKDKVRAEWDSKYSGTDNAGGIAILDGGIDWVNISLPLKDAEFIASRKITTLEIASIFNIPSYMINNGEHSTYSNNETENMRFILDVVQPDCQSIEDEMNYKMFTGLERGRVYVKFNLSSALRGDSKSRADFYTQMLGLGVYNINEVRALEDLDSIGELGEKHYFSLNYTTLETLEKHCRILTETKTEGEGNSNEV